MRVGVIGAGLVGRRTADFLLQSGAETTLFTMSDRRVIHDAAGDAAIVAYRDGDDLCQAVSGFDALVLATPSMHQVQIAHRLIDHAAAIVCTADRPEAVRALWALGMAVTHRGGVLAVGAGCSPGLSTLLVQQLASGLEHVDVVTTARFGTGGPACAREHHRSMAAHSWQIRDGVGGWKRGGSGRSLVWFPEPVGPQDCYRAGLAETFVLGQLFPDVDRVSAVQAATRRDRMTAHLPMLRLPHAEGRVGAVWAEVRGRTEAGAIEHRVMAATVPQATGAAAIAAAVASRVIHNPADCAGSPLAWVESSPMILSTLPNGVRLWDYDGEVMVWNRESRPISAARKWRRSRQNTRTAPIDEGNGTERAVLPKGNRRATD